MPSSATRLRIDWCPGDAALEAVQIAERMYPHLRRQEIIDRLVITGLWALKQPPAIPPRFDGRNRDRWRLPANLRPAALSHDSDEE